MAGGDVTLLDEAKAAYDATVAAEAAADEEARSAMHAAARDALKAMLVKKDPATGADVHLTLTELGLNLVHADLDPEDGKGVVVWSDGTIHIASQLESDETRWRLRLVEPDPGSGSWVRLGDDRDITNLAELYAAYQAAG